MNFIRYFFIFSLFTIAFAKKNIVHENLQCSVNDFFKKITDVDSATQNNFAAYYEHYFSEKRLSRHKKHDCTYLFQQALSDIEIYKPELFDEVKDNKPFLICYGLFNRYNQMRISTHNGSLFRLSSYIKDTYKIFSGWFKSV